MLEKTPHQDYSRIGLEAVLNEFLKDSRIPLDLTITKYFYPGKEDGQVVRTANDNTPILGIFTPLLSTALNSGNYGRNDPSGFILPSSYYSFPQITVMPVRQVGTGRSKLLVDYCKPIQRSNSPQFKQYQSAFKALTTIDKDIKRENPLFALTYRRMCSSDLVLELLFRSSVDNLRSLAPVLGKVDRKLSAMLSPEN